MLRGPASLPLSHRRQDPLTGLRPGPSPFAEGMTAAGGQNHPPVGDQGGLGVWVGHQA